MRQFPNHRCGITETTTLKARKEAGVHRQRKLPRNFHAYGMMEAGNVVLLPGLAWFLARPTGGAELFAMGFSTVAAVGFLIVGARYWLALGRRVAQADRDVLSKALAFADKVEIPLLIVTAIAAIGTVSALLIHGATWPVITAGLFTLLAGLEYVNYYHRQLQNFDHWSDFKRLVTTGKLRSSHMARALAAHRQAKARARGGAAPLRGV